MILIYLLDIQKKTFDNDAFPYTFLIDIEILKSGLNFYVYVYINKI